MDSQSSQLSSLSRSSQTGTFGHSEFSQEETSSIANKLSKKLGKDHTASRVGAGNSRFTYIESWKVIQLANQIFAFNGWSCSIVDISPDYIEESKGRFSVGVTAVVRITLKDGTMHEDVGYGMSENPRKGAAIENAKKEAVSDARKRALRLFGDSLGNCLYDKSHLKRIKTANGSMGEDILDDGSQMIAMPSMIVKDEPFSKMEHNEEENIPLNRPCAFAQNNSAIPPKIPPKMNNMPNNNNQNGGNRYQPYPKPNPMNNNNGNNNNNNMNGSSFPPKPASGPQMSRPMNGNVPFKPMMNGNNNNAGMNPMTGGNNLNMSSNSLNINRSSPPQVKQERPNFISPSPMIGNEEEEQFDNIDFNAFDQAGNNIQVAN